MTASPSQSGRPGLARYGGREVVACRNAGAPNIARSRGAPRRPALRHRRYRCRSLRPSRGHVALLLDYLKMAKRFKLYALDGRRYLMSRRLARRHSTNSPTSGHTNNTSPTPCTAVLLATTSMAFPSTNVPRRLHPARASLPEGEWSSRPGASFVRAVRSRMLSLSQRRHGPTRNATTAPHTTAPEMRTRSRTAT